MLDDKATQVIEEALKMPDADTGINYLLANIEALPQEVRTQLTISLIGNAFQEDTDRMNRAAEALESIVEAKKKADAKV